MNTRHTLLFLLTASTLALLTGCGNGSKSNATSAVSSSRAGNGSVKITIHWPDAPKSRQSRLIPAASKSINIQLTAPSDFVHHNFGFSTHTLAVRPTSGNTSTVTINNLLPSAAYTETATAYPNEDGTGQAQATGALSGIVVKASELTTTPDLTMNTTITSVAVTPSSTTVTAGGSAITLAATAKDAGGNVVLTAPTNFKWGSDHATLGKFMPNGETATLIPLAAGTVNISAQETEANVASASVAVVIGAASGGGTDGGGAGGGTTTDPSKVFIADSGNNRIVGLDIVPATAFTPFAGYNPQSVALDAQGRIYFSSYQPGSAKIIRVDDVTGTNQATYAPAGSTASLIAVDKQGRIYFYDDNRALSRIDDISGANLVTYNPTNTTGGHLLNGTSGIAVDSQNHIYVVQQLTGRILRFDDMTGANTVTFGTEGSDVNQFQFPHGIAIDAANRIYVTDAGNHRVVRFDDMNGTNWTTFAIPSEVGSENTASDAVGVDGSTNPHIYFTDTAAGIVYRMNDMSGGGLVHYGTTGGGSGQFQFPIGIVAK